MSVTEIKKSVLALTPKQRHSFALWLIRSDEWSDESDAVLGTALTWRDLDEQEAQNEKRKTRRNLAG